ncbi:MAG: hypothetical protein LBH17_00625 [Oscillospiraceae bacterium]|nr:hypothetical protein [Oscillospiraceae bacterium]
MVADEFAGDAALLCRRSEKCAQELFDAVPWDDDMGAAPVKRHSPSS